MLCRAVHILPVKRGMQHEKQVRTEGAREADGGELRRGAGGRRSADCGGIAAAVPVHTGLGVDHCGGRGADCAGLRADQTLGEVKQVRVRMVCVRLPRFVGGMIRLLRARRRSA